MKNLASLFKRENENEYENYFRDDNVYGDEEADDDVTTYGESEKKEGVSFNASSAPVSLKVVKPKSHVDGPSIADHLAQGSTVVLNIESLSRESAIRLIDFLMGAVHVLGGDMKSVTKTTLVFAPRNVGVSDIDAIEEATNEEPEYEEE